MSVEFELKKDTFLVNRSKKYESIYEYFYKSKTFGMSELFTICAVIGFINGKRVPFSDKGKDTRSEFFSSNDLTKIYIIMMKSEDINATLDDFANPNFIKEKFKVIEEYAEGGMQILVDEVFKGNWNGTELTKSYKKYEIDILSYINEIRSKVPF